MKIQPSLDEVRQVVAAAVTGSNSERPNRVPICASISSEFLTPSSIYLKLSAQSVSSRVQKYAVTDRDSSKSPFSFLLESAATTETIGRFSFVGAGPLRPDC